MTRPSAAELRTALVPVRKALLDGARADAVTLLAEADAAASATLADARDRAGRIAADARVQGERDAVVLRARQRARGQREARGAVLAAQARAYGELRDRARAAVRVLRDEPGYPLLMRALRERAHAELGPDAVVREHPDGGLLAEAPGRRLDLSLGTLSDEAVDRLGGEVAQLWTR